MVEKRPLLQNGLSAVQGHLPEDSAETLSLLWTAVHEQVYKDPLRLRSRTEGWKLCTRHNYADYFAIRLDDSCGTRLVRI